MADSIVNQQAGSNDLNPNVLVQGIFDTAKVGLTGYFSAETAKAALKAPTANTALLIGGVVVVAVLIFLVVKH